VSAQSAQFIECHPGAPPACLGQAQSSFARVGPAASNQDVEILVQPSRIEIGERLGQLRVAWPRAVSSRLRRRRTTVGAAWPEAPSASKSATLTSRSRPCPASRVSARRRLIERRTRAPPVFARPQAEPRAGGARRPGSGESVPLAGLGAWQIGKQPLHVLTQELRGGLLALLFSPFHGLRV